jgi:hypothetical protein
MGCLFVTIGTPVYICIESALIISPLNLFASSMENCYELIPIHSSDIHQLTCDLPTPVVPTITTTCLGVPMINPLRYFHIYRELLDNISKQ